MIVRLLFVSVSAVACGGLAAGVVYAVLEPDIFSADAPESAAKMRLFVGPARTERPILVAAYFKDHGPGHIVTLVLPKGVYLAPGQPLEQDVPVSDPEKGYAVVTWRVKASKPGRYWLTAHVLRIGLSATAVHVTPSCDAFQ